MRKQTNILIDVKERECKEVDALSVVISLSVMPLPYRKGAKGIVFISDPQLKSVAAQNIVTEILNAGGVGIMMGTVDKGSYSASLIVSEKMVMVRYPVHQNYAQYKNESTKMNLE